MTKHTRKALTALVAAVLLAMAGSAWGATYPGSPTVEINTNYPSQPSNTAVDTNTTNPIFPAPQLTLSHPTATPVGWVTGGPRTINSTVDLNAVGGGTAYNITDFDTVITNLSGATNLNGQTLNLSPTTYHWMQWNELANPFNTNTPVWIREHIGEVGDVLRLYDTDGSGYMKITARNTNTDGPGNGDLRYTGGTYLDSGTLEFSIDTSFTPANGTGNAGNITLGSLYAQWPAILKLYPPSSFIPILKIDDAIATLDTTGAQAGNVTTINSLWLTSNASDWSIDPGTGRIIQMHPTTGTYQVDTSDAMGSTFHLLSGTFDFHLVGTNVKTNLMFESNPLSTPSVFRTAAKGTLAFGNITLKPAPGHYGRLSVETQNTGQPGGIFDIRAISGNPVIDIMDPYETVAVPANSNLWDVWGVGTLRAKPGTPPQIQLMAAIPGSATPNTCTVAAAPKSAVFAPRLDIMDGAVVNDLYTGATRTYSGLNSGPLGTGILTMPGTANATLNLIPQALGYTNNFRNTLPMTLATLVLNVPGITPNIPATDSAFTQTLSGTNSPAGAMTYRIARGILRFAKPDSIRNNTTGNVTIDIAAGAPSALKLDYSAAGYDFTGPAGSRPSGILTTAEGAKIIMAPDAANTAANIASLNTTPAIFRLEKVTPLLLNQTWNIELDPSRLPAGTGFIKLVSGANLDAFADAIETDLHVTPNPVVSTITFNPANHALKSTDGDYIYIGYTRTTPSGGDGGNGGNTRGSITLDMTYLASVDLSSGRLSVVETSGDRKSWNLSDTDVTIVVDENDPSSVKYTGNVFEITFKHPTIHDGATLTVTFENATGQKTSYTTTAKTVNGVSVLTFPATGLAGGTYKITLASPTGRNPYYTGTIASAFAYTAPKGLVFTLTAAQTGDGKGITAFAEVASNDVPLSNIQVLFTLTDRATGKTVGTPKTEITVNGKTPAVTFGNLPNGTYSIMATPNGFNMKTESIITITASTLSPDPDPNSNPDPDSDPNEGKKSSGGGCNGGFGVLALALAAFGLRRRVF